METKVNNLYNYINNLSFSKVIKLYDELSRSCYSDNGSNYPTMYDYTLQEDAEWLLDRIGVIDFLGNLTQREPNERAYYTDFSHKEYFCNPWEEFMAHAEDFINYIETTERKCFSKLYKVINPSVKVKVAVRRTITNVVEIEAVNHAEALDYVIKNIDDYDPINIIENEIQISDTTFEILPN